MLGWGLLWLIVTRVLFGFLYQRLQKNPPPWTSDKFRQIKTHIKEIRYLHIADLSAFKIVKTYVSDLGYKGFIKQVKNNKE